MECKNDQNHAISLEDAAKLTKKFRDHKPVDPTLGGFFGKDAIMNILNQAGCEGIKYYYGINEHDKPVLVLVGTKSNCDDLIDGKIAEISLPCPDYCGNRNVLNSSLI